MLWRKKSAAPPDDLDARVRHVLAHGNDGIAVREPAGVVRREPQTYRIPLTCSDTGKPFFALAHISGDIIDLTDNEAATAPHRNGDCPEIPPGSYRMRDQTLDKVRWMCPRCGSNGTPWMCVCKIFWGALHCGGVFDGGPYPLLNQYCACGKLDARRLYLKGNTGLTQCLLIQYPLSRNPEESCKDKEHVPLVVEKGGKVRRQKPR